jgi:hypothetical protein
MTLGPDDKYQVLDHLGDGTFGRALRCTEKKTQEITAVKVIRAVPRYANSAKIEA